MLHNLCVYKNDDKENPEIDLSRIMYCHYRPGKYRGKSYTIWHFDFTYTENKILRHMKVNTRLNAFKVMSIS